MTVLVIALSAQRVILRYFGACISVFNTRQKNDQTTVFSNTDQLIFVYFKRVDDVGYVFSRADTGFITNFYY